MKIDVIGSSCSWYQRNNTSFVIDGKILFDISSGNYKDIIKKYDIFDIDSLIISHWHSDHIGDIKVLSTMFLRAKKKGKIDKKLKMYSFAGLDEYIIKLQKLTFSREDELDINLLRNAVEFYDINDGDEFEENGYKIKAYAVDHGDLACLGYTFTDKDGKTVAFSGDTTNCENLEKMLSISDYAFVDMAATFKNPNHLDVDGFIELQKKYPNCKMFPIHTSDPAFELGKEKGIELVNDGDVFEF